MNCKNCGCEVNGNFCQQCGTPVNADEAYAPNPVYNAEVSKPKKTWYKQAWFIILVIIGAIIILITAASGGSKGTEYNNDNYDDSYVYSDNENTEDDIVVDNTTTTTAKVTSASELLAKIDSQGFKVISTKYVVQDEEYKSLYPDLLQAVVKNNTKYEIKNAVIAFVAWDKNNLPVKIVGKYDFSGGSYVQEVEFNDINLVPGESCGSDSGLGLDRNCTNIDKFKAIAISYETFDGEKWENPYYADWCELYEGKKLK